MSALFTRHSGMFQQGRHRGLPLRNHGVSNNSPCHTTRISTTAVPSVCAITIIHRLSNLTFFRYPSILSAYPKISGSSNEYNSHKKNRNRQRPVPISSLDKIKEYIDTFVTEPKSSTHCQSGLKGIWKDKGFEKIIDLDTELKEARRQLGNTILERKF